MSDAKTPKKAEAVSKKNAPTKTETAKTPVDKAGTTSAESSAADSSTTKSASSPKSASQSSISHFSSVSTPQYRSGWDSIFGSGAAVKKTVPEGVSEAGFPIKLEISDDEIDAILRKILDDKFIDLTKNHGLNVNSSKKSLSFEYSINCEIKQK